jgi:L-alanine-DL-glutamate epimerase-like enolase superfamily enzyme
VAALTAAHERRKTGGSAVKITGVHTLVVNAKMRNRVFVPVETDQPGLCGWGEATLEWKMRAVVGAVQDFEGTIVGGVLGVLIIGVLNNGMILTSVPTFYQMVAKGVLLIAAAVIAEHQTRRYG